MRNYPTTRNASSQVWRRLRKAMTESELTDIALDLAEIIEAEHDSHSLTNSLYFALVEFAWEETQQAFPTAESIEKAGGR